MRQFVAYTEHSVVLTLPTMRMMVAALALSAPLLGACTPDIDAQPSDSRAAQAIVRTTNSPFCPGQTLDSCPSPKAAEWRTDIHEWVEADVSDAEIRARLQGRVPGFDLEPKPVAAGWLIPLAALVVSTLWFAFVSTRLRRRKPERPREPRANDDVLDARLDEELTRID